MSMNLGNWSNFDAIYDQQPPAKKARRSRKGKKATVQPDTKTDEKKKTSFTLTSLPVSTITSEEEIPELMQAAPTPEESQQSSAQVVAEQLYFNRQNSDFWQRDDLSHLRP